MRMVQSEQPGCYCHHLGEESSGVKNVSGYKNITVWRILIAVGRSRKTRLFRKSETNDRYDWDGKVQLGQGVSTNVYKERALQAE